MFILLVHYLEDLAKIDELMSAHRRYLERNYRDGTFLLSGRRVPRTGGVVLAAGEDLASISRIVESDPFVVAGVARYDILEFSPTAATGALSAALGVDPAL